MIIPLLTILFTGSWAQVQSTGKWSPDSEYFMRMATHLLMTAQYQLPGVSNLQLALQDAREQAIEPKPYKFAQAIPVDIDMEKDGVWLVDDVRGVREWQLMVSSPGALSLGLLYEDFFLPDGAEFYVIGQEATLGAFVGAVNNKEDGKFATAPLTGELVILNYVEPIERQDPRQARIRIDLVSHGFKSISPKDYQESGSCNIDVAFVMMLTDSMQRFCSGALINNVMKDGKQFLLTANHCIIGDISRFIAAYNYQLNVCNPPQAPPEPKMMTTQGMNLLAKWDQSDFALALIKETIPDSYNVFLAGWDISKKAPANVTGIHHPSGDVKKISIYTGQTNPASWMESPKQFHLEVPRWTRGVTEPGSSGSPLFNSDGLIVGHLHGGQSSCDFPTGYDIYGALAYDWASGPAKTKRLREWLNPQNRAVSALRGVSLLQARRNKDNNNHHDDSDLVILREGEEFDGDLKVVVEAVPEPVYMVGAVYEK